MNATQNSIPAQAASSSRDDSPELRELRKRLLDHIVRNDAARREREANATLPGNHSQVT